MNLEQIIKSSHTKKIALSIITSTLLLGCGSGGGGGGSSTSEVVEHNLTAEATSQIVLNTFPSSEQNISVQVGFSPVVNKRCEFYFTNATSAKVCLNTNQSEAFEKNPKISLGENRVDYYVDAVPMTEAALTDELDLLNTVVKKPLFTTNFPVDFGTHDNFNPYVAAGEVCTQNDVTSVTVSYKNANSETQIVNMLQAGNGCFTLPESAVNSNGFGTFNIEKIEAQDATGASIVLEDTVGSFTYNEYANHAPEANITLNGNPSKINSKIRDINNKLAFTCSGTDIEDGSSLTLSAKYKSSDDANYTDATLTAANKFEVTITNMGDKTLQVVCSAQDSFGVNSDANSSYEIDKNRAPIYVSGLSDQSCTEGDTITLPSATFTDAEGDDISVTLSQHNPFSCSSTGTYTYKATATDEYGMSSESPDFTITVNAAPSSGGGSGGSIGDGFNGS